ncbi:TPA: hypothetical protein ACKP9S_002789 [Pseudomonas aeruginosa]
MSTPIIVCGSTLGIDRYLATDAQAEIVKVGLINYGFLLKRNDLQARRVSFANFADCIEANCDLTTPQTAEVVKTLREVHQLQEQSPAI